MRAPNTSSDSIANSRTDCGPRIDGKEEVRLAVLCTDPLANEPDSDGHNDDWQSAVHFSFRFENVDHGLAQLWLRFGMLILSVFTSNSTWSRSHPAAARASPAWSCAKTGNVKNANKPSANIFFT
jgi:hypothetical protein